MDTNLRDRRRDTDELDERINIQFQKLGYLPRTPLNPNMKSQLERDYNQFAINDGKGVKNLKLSQYYYDNKFVLRHCSGRIADLSGFNQEFGFWQELPEEIQLLILTMVETDNTYLDVSHEFTRLYKSRHSKKETQTRLIGTSFAKWKYEVSRPIDKGLGLLHLTREQAYLADELALQAVRNQITDITVEDCQIDVYKIGNKSRELGISVTDTFVPRLYGVAKFTKNQIPGSLHPQRPICGKYTIDIPQDMETEEGTQDVHSGLETMFLIFNKDISRAITSKDTLRDVYQLKTKLDEFNDKRNLWNMSSTLRNSDLVPLKIVKLDAVGMYTFIPHVEILREYQAIIKEMKMIPTMQVLCMNILETILSTLIFQCNGKFYRQHTGLPIGAKIAPFLANLLLFRSDREIVKTDGVELFARYVDDVFIIVREDVTVGELIAEYSKDTMLTFIEDTSDNTFIGLNIQLIKENGIYRVIFHGQITTKWRSQFSKEIIKKRKQGLIVGALIYVARLSNDNYFLYENVRLVMREASEWFTFYKLETILERVLKKKKKGHLRVQKNDLLDISPSIDKISIFADASFYKNPEHAFYEMTTPTSGLGALVIGMNGMNGFDMLTGKVDFSLLKGTKAKLSSTLCEQIAIAQTLAWLYSEMRAPGRTSNIKQTVRIYSDSESTVKLTNYFITQMEDVEGQLPKKWKLDKWKGIDDMIKHILEIVIKLRNLGHRVIFIWVKGHNKELGNCIADWLTRQNTNRHRKSLPFTTIIDCKLILDSDSVYQLAHKDYQLGDKIENYKNRPRFIKNQKRIAHSLYPVQTYNVSPYIRLENGIETPLETL